jgi:hypothetical protein
MLHTSSHDTLSPIGHVSPKNILCPAFPFFQKANFHWLKNREKEKTSYEVRPLYLLHLLSSVTQIASSLGSSPRPFSSARKGTKDVIHKDNPLDDLLRKLFSRSLHDRAIARSGQRHSSFSRQRRRPPAILLPGLHYESLKVIREDNWVRENFALSDVCACDPYPYSSLMMIDRNLRVGKSVRAFFPGQRGKGCLRGRCSVFWIKKKIKRKGDRDAICSPILLGYVASISQNVK